MAAAPSQPQENILVRAIALGTYPDPGSIKAVFREVGEQFVVAKRKDLSAWMHEISVGEPAAKPIGDIPATTGGHRGIPTPLGAVLPPI